MRSPLLAPLGALLSLAVSAASPQAPAGPGPRDIVQFTHLVQPLNGDDDALREQVSPDGSKAFIVVRRGDVASDRNRYEIQLLDLAPARLSAQRAPAPSTLLAVAADHDNNFGLPAIKDAHWHGDRTLVFLGRLAGGSPQVYGLDVATRALRPLTHERGLIVSYAVSEDLRRVVYAVQEPNPPLRPGEHGVVVGSQSFWAVKFGQDDLTAQDRRYRCFVVDTGSDRPPRALGETSPGHAASVSVSIAPDGRWALLRRYLPERLDEWARRYPMIAALSTRYARSQQVDPLGYFSTPASYVPRLMTAWRLDDGVDRPVVDAPDDALPGGFQTRADLVWQGAGKSVVLGGTHLPLQPGANTSLASHVIEYWPDSGRWVDIATLDDRLTELRPLRDGFLLIDGERRRAFHRRDDGGWREGGEGAGTGAPTRTAWTLHVEQGLDQPADIVAAGPAGETVRLTRLNPQFDPATWGSMRPYAWRDAAGRRWDGGLMAASGTDADARLPLLIQTYGFDAGKFYLDGPNIYEGATSAFPGRAVLGQGVRVLAMPWSATGVTGLGGREAMDAFRAGVRGAVEALVKEGRVDPSRVGIIGWSATGERVLNLVAFDDLPIRAATMADADANTLLAVTVTYGAFDTMWGRLEELNGGLPFGDSLSHWIRNDPALHTDCIRAALRIESYGRLVLPNWDLYALLRRQYKPVEMVLVPGGTHQLGTPGDRMVSLQGNVDWYGFWLAGRTRTTPAVASETTASLAAQYARWQQMATLQAADDARPRCTR